MLNNFVYSELDDTNSFPVKVSFELGNKLLKLVGKLDTGAHDTLIPLVRAGLSNEECREQKEYYIVQSFPRKALLGVESTFNRSLKSYESMSLEDKLNYSGIVYGDFISNLTLGALNVGKYLVSINCNSKSSSALIGMDVLSKFDFHVGTSKKNGKVVFIGCLKDDITNDYLQALNEHFGYTLEDRAFARFLRQFKRKKEV